MNAPEALRNAVHYITSAWNSAEPGYIIDYDPDARSATIQLAIIRRYTDGRVDEKPKLYKVPVHFLSSSAASITVKLKKDDPVLCVFCTRNIDRVVELGGVQEPGADGFRFDINNAIAIPGDFTNKPGKPGSDNKDYEVNAGGASVVIDGGDITITDSAGDVVTLAEGIVQGKTISGSLITLGEASALVTDGAGNSLSLGGGQAIITNAEGDTMTIGGTGGATGIKLVSGASEINAAGGKVAIGATGGSELLDLLATALTEIANSTANGFNLSGQAAILAAVDLINSIKGTL